MNKPQANEQEMVTALRREAERIEEDATYSSKSHFNAAQVWERRHYWLGIPATAFAAIAGRGQLCSRAMPRWAVH